MECKFKKVNYLIWMFIYLNNLASEFYVDIKISSINSLSKYGFNVS